MPRQAARATAIVPVRLTSIGARQASPIMRTAGPSRVMPGVGHQGVERARGPPRPPRRPPGRRPGRAPRPAGRARGRRRARPRRPPPRPRAVLGVGQADVVALAREGHRTRRPDPLARPGDERDGHPYPGDCPASARRAGRSDGSPRLMASTPGTDAAHETDEHAAVAELHEARSTPWSRASRTVWVKRTGAVSCWASSERRCSPFSKAAEVADRKGSDGRADLHAREGLAQLVGGRRHHRRVEGAVHVEQLGLDAARPRQVDQAVDAALQARGHDLAGAVVVGRPHLAGLAAERLDVLVAGAEERRPSSRGGGPRRPWTRRRGPAPGAAPRSKERLPQATSAEYSPSECPIVRSPSTSCVAGDPPGGHRVGQHGRLAVLR